jgi:hypothetical protein
MFALRGCSASRTAQRTPPIEPRQHQNPLNFYAITQPSQGFAAQRRLAPMRILKEAETIGESADG